VKKIIIKKHQEIKIIYPDIFAYYQDEIKTGADKLCKQDDLNVC